MKNETPQLSPTWFAEGTIDLEYKQYILLAYLQHMQRLFEQIRLYPALGDLIFHYRNLEDFRQRKGDLAAKFPQRLTGLDPHELRLLYEAELPEDAVVAEIDAIVQFALPRVKDEVEVGRELYERVDAQLRIYPIGVLPLYRQEGYLLLRVERSVAIYQYQITLFDQGPERMRGIHTYSLGQRSYTLSNTYESLKLELIHQRPELPNPATFAVESELALPLDETLLPVLKRRLLREVEAQA